MKNQFVLSLLPLLNIKQSRYNMINMNKNA